MHKSSQSGAVIIVGFVLITLLEMDGEELRIISGCIKPPPNYTQFLITKTNKMNKMPFFIKKLTAKCLMFFAKIMIRMFNGFGGTFPNDIILYNRITSMMEELKLWIDTDGRPTTSNPNYYINTH
jgi:hypothetical protein